MADQQQPLQQQQQQQHPPPQGTEYTLQGVMRFLQVEWHNHERARNAWDIERAELKAKITKQEGDFRNSKRLNQALDKQVRMLEIALRAERAKRKEVVPNEPPPAYSDPHAATNGITHETQDASEGRSKQEQLKQKQTESDEGDEPPEELEALKTEGKQFVQKCVEELTYILTPPREPAPVLGSEEEQALEAKYQAQASNEQIYEQQQQFRRNQQGAVSHLPSQPNHHPPPVRQPAEYVNAGQPPQQAQSAPMQRQSSQPPPNFPPPLPEEVGTRGSMQSERGTRASVHQQSLPEPHNQDFDLYGLQVTARAEEIDPSQPLFAEEDGGWNFDDSSLNTDQPSQPSQHERRNDMNLFPSATDLPPKSPTRTGPHSRRRSSGSQRVQRRPSDSSHELRDTSSADTFRNFKVRFNLQGHLDVIRSIIFTGGGSPSEPELCTASDDGTLKRWIIPTNYSNFPNGGSGHHTAPPPDLDIQSYFTHRGHDGIVTSLAACPASPSFSTGGRALGDGWVFSGGQDATVRVWERGRVDPKATLEGHTDAIWALSVLPAPASSILGPDSSSLFANSNTTAAPSSENRILLASGSADGTVRVWAVTAPPQLSSPSAASAAGPRRGVGGSRRHSITSGSNFPSSPQPSTASGTPFHHTLIHSIPIPGSAGIPTCIAPLSSNGSSFVVSYTDASVLIFDTRTAEQVVGMASAETYDGTSATGVNSVVVTSAGVDNVGNEGSESGHVEGATGSNKEGEVEGVVITGHEDRFVRFFDAMSGQCTYSMLAHTSAISSLSLSPSGDELLTGGHDASIRVFSLEKRQNEWEDTKHRLFRGEGVVSCVWSNDGRWVVSGGGDGVGKVWSR